MVNLRAIANQVTRSINPNVGAELHKSTGYTTADTGKRTPTYRKVPINVQIQSLTFSDLHQLDGINLEGVRRAIYCNTQIAAMIRVAVKGGDLIVFPAGTVPEGTTWLAAHVLERWPDWCKIAITLQNEQLEAIPC